MADGRNRRGREWDEFLRLLAHEAPTMENARRDVERALASGEITQEELDRSYAKHWSPAAASPVAAPGTVGSYLGRWLQMHGVTEEALARDWGCDVGVVESLRACAEPIDQANMYEVVSRLAAAARVAVTQVLRALNEGGLSREIQTATGRESVAARSAPDEK